MVTKYAKKMSRLALLVLVACAFQPFALQSAAPTMVDEGTQTEMGRRGQKGKRVTARGVRGGRNQQGKGYRKGERTARGASIKHVLGKRKRKETATTPEKRTPKRTARGAATRHVVKNRKGQGKGERAGRGRVSNGRGNKGQKSTAKRQTRTTRMRKSTTSNRGKGRNDEVRTMRTTTRSRYGSRSGNKRTNGGKRYAQSGERRGLGGGPKGGPRPRKDA
jgi:hypothetical protein